MIDKKTSTNISGRKENSWKNTTRRNERPKKTAQTFTYLNRKQWDV